MTGEAPNFCQWQTTPSTTNDVPWKLTDNLAYYNSTLVSLVYKLELSVDES